MPNNYTPPQNGLGIIERLQLENRELRRDFEEFKAFVSDYLSDIDDEIKGYELAAKFTGLSRSTMKELVKQKRIHYKKEGRAISFSRKDLVEYKRSRRLGKGQSLEAWNDSHKSRTRKEAKYKSAIICKKS